MSGATASKNLSWLSLHQISAGVIDASPTGMFSSTTLPPHLPSLSNSATALPSPPAPRSCIKAIGLSTPSCAAAIIASTPRLSISGLARCTEAKSSCSLPCPAVLSPALSSRLLSGVSLWLCDEDLDPPPMPIFNAKSPSSTK